MPLLRVNPKIEPVKNPKFPVDNEPISHQKRSIFQTETKEEIISNWRKLHNRRLEINHRGQVIVFHHPNSYICSCHAAKVIRLRELEIPELEWYNYWERI